jgi:hypothetical protein
MLPHYKAYKEEDFINYIERIIPDLDRNSKKIK